jgi:hypothetical protein
MKLALKIAFFLLGLVLLWRLAVAVDLKEVGSRLQEMGIGIAFIVGINVAAVSIDTMTWSVILRKIPFGARGLWELWKIRMVGTSYNQLIPAIGVGGEPIKAVLLKRHMGIGYREGSASMVAFETVNLLALISFSLVAYMVCNIVDSALLSLGWILPVGLLSFSAAIVGFFIFQRYRVASILLSAIHRGWWRQKLEKLVAGTKFVETWLVDFYVRRSRSFALSLALSSLTVVMGGLELHVASIFLDSPIGFWTCLALIAFVEVVKAGTFFVPGRIGTQDVAIVSVVTLVTGDAAIGLSLAVVRRIRELIMIIWGVAIGWRYSLRDRLRPPEEIGSGSG